MAENITTWPFSKDDVLVCKTCGKQVNSSDCELLEGTLLEVFEVVLIKLNFTTTQPVICKDCSKKLLDAFEHKSKWIYTEDRLFPYINSATDAKVDIKTVYLDKSCCRQSDFKNEIQICRLCIGLINDNSWNSLFDVLEKRYSLKFFEKYVPDLNLNATENPIICKRCLDSFSVFMDFISLCQDREVKTEEYLEDVKIEEYFVKDELETTPNGLNPALVQDLEQNKLECDSKWHVGTLKCTTYLHMSKDKSHLLEHALIHKAKKREKLTRGQMTIFKCELCFFKTKFKGNIERHKLTHKPISTVKVFKCEFCSFETIHKRNLGIHILIHKSPAEMKLFKCDLCSYKTKFKRTLQKHNLTHKPLSSVKLFKCESCSFEAIREDSLQQHILTHKSLFEVEVFKCDLCSYKTKFKTNLSKHILTHKSLSEVEVFKCDFCSYKTKYKAYLPDHILIHKPPSSAKLFKCEFCSFETIRKRNLQTHILVHKSLSEVEIFSCELCSYKTKYKINLQSHILIHKPISSIKVFKCERCSFETKHKYSIQRHIRIYKHRSKVDI